MGGFIDDIVDTVGDFVGGAGEILDSQLGFDPNGGGFVPVYDSVGTAFGLPSAGSAIAQGSGLAQSVGGLLGGGSSGGGLLGGLGSAGLSALSQQQNNLKLDEISDELLAKLSQAIDTQTNQAQQAIDFQQNLTNRLPSLLGKAEKRGINVLRGETGQALNTINPFTKLGQNALTSLSDLTRNPQKQAEFIQNNPFYNALADSAQSRVFGNQAAKGKLGSGETAKSLQNELLKVGSDLLQREIGNRQNLVNTGLQGGQLEAGIRQGLGRNLSDVVNTNAQFQSGLQQRGAENISGTRQNLGNVLSNLLQQQGSVIGTELSRKISPLSAGLSSFIQPTTGGQQGGSSTGSGLLGGLVNSGLNLLGGGSSNGFDFGNSVGGVFNSGGGGDFGSLSSSGFGFGF